MLPRFRIAIELIKRGIRWASASKVSAGRKVAGTGVWPVRVFNYLEHQIVSYDPRPRISGFIALGGFHLLHHAITNFFRQNV